MKKKNTFEVMKRWLSGGQHEALLRKVYLAGGGDEGGADAIREVLSGDRRIELVDASKTLVDANGRFIPTELGVTSRVVDANRAYHLVQPPAFDYDTLVSRTGAMFQTSIQLTGREMEERCLAVLARIEGERQMKKLSRGAYFPFVIPQTTVVDIGTTTEEFVNALSRAYADSFPLRRFRNYRTGDLANKVQFVAESRQENLLAALRTRPVVGVIFATAFQGFSIAADREAIQKLPSQYLLGGVFDGLAAIIGHTAVFGRDGNTPGIDLAANSWESVDYSLHFYALSGEANFGHRSLGADEDFSAMLSVLG